jgi:hypothetical protein
VFSTSSSTASAGLPWTRSGAAATRAKPRPRLRSPRRRRLEPVLGEQLQRRQPQPRPSRQVRRE